MGTFHLALFSQALGGWYPVVIGLGLALVANLACPILATLERLGARVGSSLPLVVGTAAGGAGIGLGLSSLMLAAAPGIVRQFQLLELGAYHLLHGQIGGETLLLVSLGTLLGGSMGGALAWARRRGWRPLPVLALSGGLGLGLLGVLVATPLGYALGVGCCAPFFRPTLLGALLRHGYLGALAGTGLALGGLVLFLLQFLALLPFVTSVATPLVLEAPGRLTGRPGSEARDLESGLPPRSSP